MATETQGHDIVVIGASAGGVGALSTIARQLPRDFPAALFVVVHLSAEHESALPEILSHQGLVRAIHPENGAAIEHGTMYVAPPDHHMLVEPGRVRLNREVRENRFRPAIDVLFRSAAISYGPRVIGVVLTGFLDDGAAGLLAIKRCNGLAVIQDPEEADHPSMPRAALSVVEADHLLRLDMAGDLLTRLVRTRAGAGVNLPAPLPQRVGRTATEPPNGALHPGVTGVQIGAPTALVCPECGGGLFEVQDGTLKRYRCHVGHVFSAESLLASQGEALERALWAAVRTLEERASLLQSLSDRAEATGGLRTAHRFDARAVEMRSSAETLRELLQELG